MSTETVRLIRTATSTLTQLLNSVVFLYFGQIIIVLDTTIYCGVNVQFEFNQRHGFLSDFIKHTDKIYSNASEKQMNACSVNRYH